MTPFSRPWWVLVLVLAPLGSAAAYWRWLHPHPYPVPMITGGAVLFVVLSSAIGLIERKRARRDHPSDP